MACVHWLNPLNLLLRHAEEGARHEGKLVPAGRRRRFGFNERAFTVKALGALLQACDQSLVAQKGSLLVAGLSLRPCDRRIDSHRLHGWTPPPNRDEGRGRWFSQPLKTAVYFL